MKTTGPLTRKSHFLGTKIRSLRKRVGLTMEDLSARCIKVDADHAPSVSYLSMIERGKRVPSADMLEVIAAVFQKDVQWFLDDAPEDEHIAPVKQGRGGIDGMALEPGFLFSSDILQIAIPELLAQTGTTGRQFAHLLIRAHQEHHRNHFPDLERAADEVGGKRLPLTVDDLLEILRHMDLDLRWFQRAPEALQASADYHRGNIVRSYFEPPGTIWLNESLKAQPARLKYDLAIHIAHCVLHNRDGLKSVLYAGRDMNVNLRDPAAPHRSSMVDSRDILYAWRDFECSFFAGALLCPRVPFRQLLDRSSHEVSISQQIEVSASVVMRRMTAVSPYPHWHYFDAYSPGTLKAVYRANGIPLPWGNMRHVEDPCQHWSVFNQLNRREPGTAAQLSVMQVKDAWHLYACESLRVEDMAGNGHVLCAGVDLNPAIEAQGREPAELAEAVQRACVAAGGSAPVPGAVRRELQRIAGILNIAWVARSAEVDAQLICPRGAVCPRVPSCYPTGGCQS